MKKIIFLLTAVSFLFSSCGEKEAESVKIDTKDVKGTISADGVSLGETEMHTNDGVYEVPDVKFNDDCRFQIVPTNLTFEEEWAKEKENSKNFGREIKVIVKKGGAVIYEEKSEFAGKKKEGFNFLVWIKGDKKNYVITGEGNTPFDPIPDKADAEKAFEAAQTFKPE